MKEGRLLFLLAIVQFAHIVDFMIIMPLGAQFMDLFDINPRQFSWIVSIYALSAFGSGLISASFLDRFDRKSALLTLFFGFTIGTFACGLASNFMFLLIARSFTGAFGGILSALVLSVVADMVPLERRSAAMGLIMTAFSAASIVGVPAGIFLAAKYSWNVPFFVVGALSAVVWIIIWIIFPRLTGHIHNDRPRPKNIFKIIRKSPNQQRALLFTLILMLGHFTIIPFIAPFMQMNIGFTDFEVTYIYLIGGGLTVVVLPLTGRLADRFGNALTFGLFSILAVISIFAITNLPQVGIPLALIATSSFFIVASGRNVPATTLVTAVVKPENRAGFMSIRSSATELGLALGSAIAGFIVLEEPNGSLGNYEIVGYFAIIMSVIAVWFARKLKVAE